ncbi:PfkB family carbohydrate kinase [Alphaproteobacteria bacterium]|nr:PfkB family carbohydrate kinase [Alphaproteobacteria bacterium]
MTISDSTKLALETIRTKAVDKERIIFVSGTFNIVHPGHLRLLRFAAECGDFLVVGVLANSLVPGAHLQEDLRLEGVSAINWVGHAFVLDDTPANFISALHPAVVVKGKEHENTSNTEQVAVKEYGGQLLYGSGDTIFSSLELLGLETELVNHSSIIKPTEYIVRNGIDLRELDVLLARMQGLKVCVIGDTIVDEYIQCDPLGMSQEDPTIVVTPIMSNKFLGGAAIVAAHARGLGAGSVSLITVTGEDETKAFMKDKLQAHGVDVKLVIDENRPTSLKQRYRAGNKTLLRVSHLRQNKINKNLQQQMRDHVFAALVDADLLIFSDFNYGVLPQDLVDEISQECIKRGIMMVADSQSSSQVGDISRFKNTALLTPTEREARLALSNYEDGLVVLAEALRNKTNAQNIVITLGAEGLLIHAGTSNKSKLVTDRLPALNTAPKDTAGAGDCLLVCTAMALVLGRPIMESLYLGAVAAACQVGRIGNIPLTTSELLREVHKSNGIY